MATIDDMKAKIGTVIGTSEWVLVDSQSIGRKTVSLFLLILNKLR